MTKREIDPAALHILLKKHGILLEHQTKDKLSRYFQRKADSVLLSERVGFEATEPRMPEPFEVDVCIEAETRYESLRCIHSHPERTVLNQRVMRDKAIDIKDAVVRDIIVVECKGHPQDGFLLCKLATESQIEPKNPKLTLRQSFFVRHPSIDPIDGWRDKPASFLTDWAQFYKVKGDKPTTPLVYQEDKAKFDVAIEQARRNWLLTLKNMDAVFQDSERHHGWCIVRPLSLIVTNAQICAMLISNEKVQFVMLPWIAYVDSPAFAARHGIKDELLRHNFIVGFNYLEQFLDIYLALERDFKDSPAVGPIMPSLDLSALTEVNGEENE